MVEKLDVMQEFNSWCRVRESFPNFKKDYETFKGWCEHNDRGVVCDPEDYKDLFSEGG